MTRFLLNFPGPGQVAELPLGVQILSQAHDPESCEGDDCCIHHPSPHHMRGWPLLWRQKSEPFEIGPPLMERVCEHGVGHPDPDHITWVEKARGKEAADVESVHGCDGCCADGPRLVK